MKSEGKYLQFSKTITTTLKRSAAMTELSVSARFDLQPIVIIISTHCLHLGCDSITKLHDEIKLTQISRKNCSSTFSVIQSVYISHAHNYCSSVVNKSLANC